MRQFSFDYEQPRNTKIPSSLSQKYVSIEVKRYLSRSYSFTIRRNCYQKLTVAWQIYMNACLMIAPQNLTITTESFSEKNFLSGIYKVSFAVVWS